MRKAELHAKDYEALKSSILSDIWFSIKDRDGATLEVMERKGIPAIVTITHDDQISETIDELIVRKDKVIAIASSLYDDVVEYDLDNFEAPMLIKILESVEKHLAKEDETIE